MPWCLEYLVYITLARVRLASIFYNMTMNPILICSLLWREGLMKNYSGDPVPCYLIPAWLHIEGMYTKLCWKDDEGAQEKMVKLTTMNVNMSKKMWISLHKSIFALTFMILLISFQKKLIFIELVQSKARRAIGTPIFGHIEGKLSILNWASISFCLDFYIFADFFSKVCVWLHFSGPRVYWRCSWPLAISTKPLSERPLCGFSDFFWYSWPSWLG